MPLIKQNHEQIKQKFPQIAKAIEFLTLDNIPYPYEVAMSMLTFSALRPQLLELHLGNFTDDELEIICIGDQDEANDLLSEKLDTPNDSIKSTWVNLEIEKLFDQLS